MTETGTAFSAWLANQEPDEEERAAPRPWWRRRLRLIIISVVVLVALVGGGVWLRGSLASTPPQYEFGVVTTGNLTLSVSATGPLQAQATYNLSSPTSATVTELDVQVGQQVQAGQVLAKMDPAALQDAVNQAQAALNSAWASYHTAVLSLQQARDQNDPCPPPKTQTECTIAIDQAQAGVGSAWAQVQQAQAARATAQHNLQGATLAAPANGTVVAINGAVGSPSGSGPFIVLEDLSQLSITAQVNEADIGNVQVGQAVRFSVAAYPSATFHGLVSTISPLGQTSSGVVTYPVTITIDSQSLNGTHLLPGMTANLQITTQERIGVLLVPARAISFTNSLIASGQLSRSQVSALLASAAQQAGAQSQGTPAIVVELHNGQLTPKVIFTGLTDAITTEVLSGLDAGEQVVIGQVNPTSTPASANNSPGGKGGGGILGGGGGK